MFSKHKLVKSTVFTLIITAILSISITSTAFAASPLQNKMDEILNAWNSYPVWEYNNAYQCNAYTRFAFQNMYGHRDGTKCQNCNTKYFYGPNSTELKKDFKNFVSPGDVVRITSKQNARKTHTFLVYQISDDYVTIIESNVDGGKTNYAYKNVRSYSGLLKSIMGSDSAYTGYRIQSTNQPYSGTEQKVIYGKITDIRKSYSVNKIGVRLDAKILSDYTPIVETGVQLKTNTDTAWSYVAKDCNLNIVDKYVNTWYVLPRDLGVSLSKTKTYIYRFYAIDSNGTIYYSNTDSFKLNP